jgi:hypothetical protein
MTLVLLDPRLKRESLYRIIAPEQSVQAATWLPDRGEPMEDARGILKAMIDAAVRAPSGDNTQPWRFRVDLERRCIALQLDEGRDPSPMNAGQRMARIAAGAALENILHTAALQRWTVVLEPAGCGDMWQVRLIAGRAKPIPSGDGDDGPVSARVTNRRLYDPRPVSREVLDRLERETPPLAGVSTGWIVDRGRLASLARLIGRADALMFGEPSMRRAFLSQVRFDAPPATRVSEGLSLAALELTAADRLALRVMKRIPDRVFPVALFARVFAAKARQLVEHASGLCLVVASDDREPTDLVVGRVMERAWLALTTCGLAVQPMMSLLVLENVLGLGPPALVAALGRDRLTALAGDFRCLVPEIGDQRPAFLMRFGFAPAPSGRTGRRPLSSVVQVLGAERVERVDEHV